MTDDLELLENQLEVNDKRIKKLEEHKDSVEPELKFEQVANLPAGLARFLVERINAISGISTPRDALEELVQAPLARACFVLAKEFGWTPEEVSAMTIGQILLYLEMTHRNGDAS